MEVRFCSKDDLQQVNNLYNLLQQSLQHLRKIKMPNEKTVSRFSAKDINNILVAEENNNIVGFARFGKIKENEWCGKCIELEEIFVKKEFEKQGIGQALMHRLKEIAQEKNVTIHLWMHPENKRALEFYKKEGFTTIGLEMCL